MKLYLIRHGMYKTDDIYKIPDGSQKLTDEAIAQLDTAGEALSNKEIEMILTSPVKRAYQTAEILAQKLNVQVSSDKVFSERRRPTEILGKSTFSKDVQMILKKIDENYLNMDYRYSDEENFTDLKARGIEALKKLVSQNYKAVALVTHAEFGTMLISLMLLNDSLTPDMYLKLRQFFFMGLGTPSLFVYENENWRIQQWNILLDKYWNNT